MFSPKKSELEKEGNNCFADEFYVSCLKEREVFQGSQVKLLGDYARVFLEGSGLFPPFKVLGMGILLRSYSRVRMA